MFSIAPQSVALPGGGPTLVFAVGDPDTSKVTLTVAGRNAAGNDGTHVFTFNRNGALQGDAVFTPTVAPHPLAGYGSVNDEPVRAPLPPKPEPKTFAEEHATAAAPKVDAPLPPKTVTSKTLDPAAPAI